MQQAYEVVLWACAAAVLALVALRAARWRRQPWPGWGRLLNEWAWTAVPLMVLGFLLWLTR